jgi:parvulin-like peptidyl-prolyl isomerase
MTIRSRPVLDRKHRPRWQDELRTQQLTVIAFAIAIAVALGIFGAAAWNGYWESHLRPVATVAGSSFTRGDLAIRERIITAETVAQATELNDQLSGGPRDQVIQQQIESLSQRLSSLSTTATTSLVDGAVLRARADAFGVAVTDDEVDAAVAERIRLPERISAQLIFVNSLPDDAEAGAEPTEEQVAAARAEAENARERVEGGAVFATVATEVSDDFTASAGGILGWFEDGDTAYDEYFDALADAEVGDVVGPVETERGFAVLELLARREATTEGGLAESLEREGVDDAAFRDYVSEELLVDGYRAHFAEEVIASPAPQRRVAEIVIRSATEAVPQERARHVLVQPDPGAESQADASDEAWDAALAEAREVADLVAAEDADWFAIAEEHSDDTGSGGRGGDLGWYDPTASPFVAEFAAALAALEPGEISDPVRTEFGYHVIQKTGQRESPQAQAAELVEELRADPDSFAERATMISENHETAAEGGELGWVAAYQLDAMLEDAIFALSEVGEISDPIEAENGDITTFQLLETSESREIEDERLEEIQGAGFDRWLSDEVRAGVETWVDPQFASTAATS